MLYDLKWGPIFYHIIKYFIAFISYHKVDDNDVLYWYSISAYYGKGNKIYLFAKCNIIRNLDFWLRIAHTIYTDRQVLKSGLDEIDGNKMTKLKPNYDINFKFMHA